MADIDLTAENSSAREKHGIKSYVHVNGPLEAHYLILDEKKIAERYLIDSVTAADSDVMELIKFQKGDVLLGGWSEVLATGGIADSLPLWGTSVDDNLWGTLNPDAAVGTIVSSLLGPLVALVDGTIELFVVDQILIRSVAASTGRWGLSALLYKGSGVRNMVFENYLGDPNTTPQA